MYALGCLALAATVASCGSNANKKAAADSTATAQAQAPAEDEGWTVIFDGKTLDGWRGYDKTGVPLDSVFAGAGVLGAAACAVALYGALQWRRSRKAR